ncbi:MAG: tryptophan 2,3-dioxygenase [Calditrichaeota bacterium]|nr:MAG: tryptophan 2,3-dioxygenase [Calditrichota bacterium]
MADSPEPIRYGSYLQLERILSGQKLRSAEVGAPAHDEMLFIIIHQAYELWFKQILHELDSVMEMFRRDYVDEKNIGIAVARLHRVVEIFKLLIDQIRILETMTPLDFLDFRNLLTPASGFQSLQFRMIEVKLGLRPAQRVRFSQQAYHSMFPPEEQERLQELEQEPSLFDLLQRWLERTPFLELGEFNFLNVYHRAVQDMLEEEQQAIRENPALSEAEKTERLKLMKATEKHFDSIFEEEQHNRLIREGRRRLSYQATLAALFIHLYRDQPILHLPYKLLSQIVDIDELLSAWRYRHALMVLRMIGHKTGTGGSAGYSYLKNTAESHRIFADLFNLSTFLIPRSKLPDLPPELEQNLGFFFTAQSPEPTK